MTPFFALWFPPLATSAILLAATYRAWRHHRRFKTMLGLGSAFAWIAFTLGGLPDPLPPRLAPIYALCAVFLVCALGERRHAPDFGQRGLLWVAPRAAAPALLGALGLLIANALRWACPAPDFWQLPLLFVGSLACLLPIPRALRVT